MSDHFANAVNRVDLLDGVVRIELATFIPDDTGGASQVRNAIYIPLAGFLQSMATLDGFVREMANRGVIRIGAGAPEAVPPAPPSSPNFG